MTLGTTRKLLLLAMLLTPGCTPRPTQVATGAPTGPCALSRRDQLWIQASLDLWDLASSRYLARDLAAPPWILHHDGTCLFHLDAPSSPGAGFREDAPLSWRGRPVAVWSGRHGGSIELPSGSSVPASARAAAGTYEVGGPRPFFNMSLMSLWLKAEPSGPASGLSTEMLTIAQHEMTHTLHMPALHAAAARMFSPAAPVKLDDDAVQDAFRSDEAYVRDFQQELELLYRAYHTDGPAKRDLVRQSLAAMRARHARYFTGANQRLAELEPLFLFVEGAGEWVRFRLAKDARTLPDHRELQEVDPNFDNYSALRAMTEAQALDFVRGNRRYWVQDHGLALFAVLGQLAPDWPKALAEDEIRSPYVMLAEAVER